MSTAVLDGFTVTGGNADSYVDPHGYGGGMYNDGGSPTVTNVTFSSNSAFYGGGMSNRNNSNPTLTNVAFTNNWSLSVYAGGGMDNGNSNPTLTNVTFSGNWATNDGSSRPDAGGGGMYNNATSPILTNVTFSGNSALNGGGMFSDSGQSSPMIRNAIFWRNTALNGSQIYDYYPGSNVLIDHSVVQGGCPAGCSTCTHIIAADPRLGPFGYWGGPTQTVPLLPGSSAIDAANDAYCPPADQRGVPRPQGAHCDIGAFEAQFPRLNLPLISR